MAEEHLTIEEVAQRLSCSRRQVIRLVDCGRLKAIDIGLGGRRKLRVTLNDVCEFEISSQTAAKAKPRPKPKGIPQHVTAAKIERARKQLAGGSRR